MLYLLNESPQDKLLYYNVLKFIVVIPDQKLQKKLYILLHCGTLEEYETALRQILKIYPSIDDKYIEKVSK